MLQWWNNQNYCKILTPQKCLYLRNAQNRTPKPCKCVNAILQVTGTHRVIRVLLLTLPPNPCAYNCSLTYNSTIPLRTKHWPRTTTRAIPGCVRTCALAVTLNRSPQRGRLAVRSQRKGRKFGGSVDKLALHSHRPMTFTCYCCRGWLSYQRSQVRHGTRCAIVWAQIWHWLEGCCLFPNFYVASVVWSGTSSLLSFTPNLLLRTSINCHPTKGSWTTGGLWTNCVLSLASLSAETGSTDIEGFVLFWGTEHRITANKHPHTARSLATVLHNRDIKLPSVCKCCFCTHTALHAYAVTDYVTYT